MQHLTRLSPRLAPRSGSGLIVLLVLSSSLGLACGVQSEPQRLGYTDVQLNAPAADQPATTPTDFTGHWRGQASDVLDLGSNADGSSPAFTFPSGSSDITLDIEFPGQVLNATLVFGSAAAPPATDPFASYPPGTTFNEYDPHPAALEGRRYNLSQTIVNSEIAPGDRLPDGHLSQGPGGFSLADSDGILRLVYQTAEAYSDWCALQPSLPSPTNPHLFNCLGADGVDQASDGNCYTYDNADADPSVRGQGIIANPSHQVDCARAFACFDQCVCDDPNAYANGGAAPPVGYRPCRSAAGGGAGGYANIGALWLREDGTELVGAFTGDASFVNARGARTTLGLVHFQRIE